MRRRNLLIFDNTGQVTAKQCGKCRITKPLTDFYPRDKSSPHPSQKHQSRCKRCQNPNYDKPRFEDLTGRKYNLLTVRGRDGKFYLAVCECGGEIKVSASNIKSGNTKSCGCLRTVTNGVKPRYAWECG